VRSEQRVLHVLPHPGGGGERYVDLLDRIDGYRFERVYLTPRAAPRWALAALAQGVVRAHRTARGFDLLHVHGEVASALLLVALARRPAVVSTHGLNLLRRSTGGRRLLARAALAGVVRAASRTICTSQPELAEVVASLGPWARRRVVAVPNGVAAGASVSADERDAARAVFGLGDSEVVGAWVGSLDRVKDPLTAIAAAQRLRADGVPFVLLVAGEGSLRRDVENAVARADGARILGHRDDVRIVLAAADLHVNSSAREGLAFSVLDAMALGLPTVASDIPGNRAALGASALYATPGAIDSFVAALRSLAADVEARSRLGAEARSRVCALYCLDSMREQTRAVYDLSLSTKKR
jgi:glycosyltransferase involved in cell wall biosynthesis